MDQPAPGTIVLRDIAVAELIHVAMEVTEHKFPAVVATIIAQLMPMFVMQLNQTFSKVQLQQRFVIVT